MLNDLLNQLKKAIKENRKKDAEQLYKQLNKLGMDNYTIEYLIKSC